MNFAANFGSFFDKGKTFRPKKKFQPGTLKYSLHKQAQASLNSGINLRQVSFLVGTLGLWPVPSHSDCFVTLAGYILSLVAHFRPCLSFFCYQQSPSEQLSNQQKQAL